jgi:hypothetical protein
VQLQARKQKEVDWCHIRTAQAMVQRFATENLQQVTSLLCRERSGIVMEENRAIAKNTWTLSVATQGVQLIGLASETSFPRGTQS